MKENTTPTPKRTPKSTFVMQLTFVVLFFVILCLPLTLMTVLGPDKYDRDVLQETETSVVPLKLDSYIDGSFHKSFEDWFSKNYPFRSEIVTLYNKMKHEIENLKPAIWTMTKLNSFGSVYRPTSNRTPINSGLENELLAAYLDPENIYSYINREQLAFVPEEPVGFKGNSGNFVGKSGFLFESSYMDEYYGFSEPYTAVTKEGIEMTVDRLQYIQDELKERYGITMLYVISPSKASHLAKFIPDHYVNRFTSKEGYVRPIDIMREELQNSTINYLDSAVYYKQIGLYAVFPKTGIHWNHVASFEISAKIAKMYADISGKSVKLPHATDVISSPNPFKSGNNDIDLFNVLYGAMGNAPEDAMDEFYYAPKVTVENKDAQKINVFIQGGSFTSDIVYNLEAYGVADTHRIYYNGASAIDRFDDDANPWTKGIYAWGSILNNIDLMVFEQNEQQIRSGHITDGNWADQSSSSIGSNAIYDSLYEYLRATDQ